ADKYAQHRACEQAGIGQRQRERQCSEDGKPDDVFATEPIAQRSAKERARGVRGEKDEQIKLACLSGDTELVDQIKYVIARQARHIELLGEQQRDQYGQIGRDTSELQSLAYLV